MFTGVLGAEQPHHFHSSSRSYRPFLRDDGPTNLARPRGPCSATQNNTDSGVAPQGVVQPQQYVAHSLQRQLGLATQTPLGNSKSSSHDDAEHMLRRKTPNGTLAAGYDGDPTDLDARPNAVKRFLVPLSHEADSKKNQPGTPHAYTDCLLPSQLDQPYMVSPLDARGRPRRAEHPGQIRLVKSPSLNGSATYQDQGVDSVLNQGMFLQHDPNFANGQHVPTVLQPMWPPCIGLTSMNNTGPCGPYWPDGAYEPYRPAPVRDPRYYQRAGVDSVAGLNSASCNTTWLPLLEASHQYHHQERYGGLDPSSTLKRRLHGDIERSGQRGPYPFERDSVTFWQQNNDSLPIVNSARSRSEHDSQNQWGGSDLHCALRVTSPQPTNEGTHAQFKEKILIWAHKIYVDLLTFIHHSRRNERNDQHPGERHFPSKLYPKPPRQSLCQSSVETAQKPLDHHEWQISMLGSPLEVPLVPKRSDKMPHFGHPASHGYGAASNLRQSSSTGSRTWGQPFEAHKQQLFSTPIRQPRPFHSYDHSESAGSVQPQLEHPSAAAAIHAMEMLSRLCSESGWQWTDGMLLGGCLAYALGDLTRALKWYSKVLNYDPKYDSHFTHDDMTKC